MYENAKNRQGKERVDLVLDLVSRCLADCFQMTYVALNNVSPMLFQSFHVFLLFSL